MKAMIQIGLLTAAIAATCAVAPAAQAAGTLYQTTNGGHCKASSGPGASLFYFSNLYAENISSSGQYLVCNAYGIERDDEKSYTTDGTTSFSINASVLNPTTAAATATCALVLGWQGQVASNIVITVKSPSVPAGGNAAAFFSGTTDAPIKTSYAQATVNCMIPAGLRLGFIDVYQPKNF